MSSLTYKNSDALWHGRFIGWHFTPQMFPSNFGRYGQWLGPFATDFQWNSQPVHSKYPRKMRQPVQGSEFLDHAMSPCPHVLPTYYMLPTVNPFLVLIIGVDQRKKTLSFPIWGICLSKSIPTFSLWAPKRDRSLSWIDWSGGLDIGKPISKPIGQICIN